MDKKRKYSITLRDKKSGDQRTFTQEYKVDEHYGLDGVNYMWKEGNYSCDCNRSRFLWNQNGDKLLDCNTGENQIELVELKRIDNQRSK